MARRATPWYWKERHGWYVSINGRRHALGIHPPDAPKPKKGKSGWNPPEAILEAFAGLKSEPLSGNVNETLFEFVKWSFENRSKATARRYKQFCEPFAKEHMRVP